MSAETGRSIFGRTGFLSTVACAAVIIYAILTGAPLAPAPAPRKDIVLLRDGGKMEIMLCGKTDGGTVTWCEVGRSIAGHEHG